MGRYGDGEDDGDEEAEEDLSAAAFYDFVDLFELLLLLDEVGHVSSI